MSVFVAAFVILVVAVFVIVFLTMFVIVGLDMIAVIAHWGNHNARCAFG